MPRIDKSKHGIGAGGIVAILIVAAILFGGFGRPGAIGGVGAPGPAAPQPVAACAVAPSVAVQAGYFDPSKVPSKFTLVAIAGGVYHVGDSIAVKTATLSATVFTGTLVQCNDPKGYWAFAGDNSGYYQNFSRVVYPTGAAPNQSVIVTMAKITAPSFTMSNLTSFGNAAAPGIMGLHKGSGGYGNGQVVSEFKATEQTTTGWAGAPPSQGGYQAIGLLYNSSQFTCVIPGAPAVTAQYAPVTNTFIGSPTQIWFRLPSLAPQNVTTIGEACTTVTLNSNTAFSANIYMYYQPATSIIQNGAQLNGVLYNTTAAAAPIASTLIATERVWQT